MDVALTSSDYSIAVKRAINILEKEVPEIKTLNGAQFIFQISGTWMITYLCAYLTLIYTSRMPEFTDPNSDTFIEDSTGVALMTGCQAFFISTCFMNVFDTVGETILYCYASEQRRRMKVDTDKHQYSLEESYTVRGNVRNVWDFFFGDDSSDEEGLVDFAPQKLKEVINETRRGGEHGR